MPKKTKWQCAKCDGFDLPKHSIHCDLRENKPDYLTIPDDRKVLKEEYKQDISEWMNIGKKRGYWKYFKDAFKKKIRDDLIFIADQGEYEDLRREVTDYFKKLI